MGKAFTPMSGAGLYALGHFFYWQFLSFNGGRLAHRRIQRALSLYVNSASVEEVELGLFHTLFVKAAAFRLFGAMLCLIEAPDSYSVEQVKKRAELLRLVLYDEVLQQLVG